jgi:lysophospholipase L1-like esterase
MNKVKIRQVLMYRIKNCKPNFKKIIAFILIAVVFFGAGLFAGRGITRHRLGKNLNGKPAIQRKMPKGFGRNKNFKINGGNKTQTSAQGQTQN